RHTRSDRDWSSDVCSSDLQRLVYQMPEVVPEASVPSFAIRTNEGARAVDEPEAMAVREDQAMFQALQWRPARALPLPLPFEGERSEERRVGNERDREIMMA